MDILVDNEFRNICSEIVVENKTEDQWAAIESDDMFQTSKYCGGYDATEMAFCFSYYDEEQKEFWFQLTLAEIQRIVNRQIEKINIRSTE